MPQITQRQITEENHPLPLVTPALLPGMTAPILTGSGWIRLHLSAQISNPTAAPVLTTFSYLIDGVEHDADDTAHKQQTIPATSKHDLSIEWYMRLGNGTHTFQILALSAAANVIIIESGACMNIWDVGY